LENSPEGKHLQTEFQTASSWVKNGITAEL